MNTTDPGLDTDPSPPGAPVSLAKLEEMDPIFDEEGDAGGLPEYDPLKFGEGIQTVHFSVFFFVVVFDSIIFFFFGVLRFFFFFRGGLG